MSDNLPCCSSKLSSSDHASSSSSAMTSTHNHQQAANPKENQQQTQQMQNIDENADGQLKLRLDHVLGMQLEQKSVKTATIGRFSWELGALKHNILNEGNSPKSHLIVYLHCNELGKRLDGWSCTARVKITLESDNKSTFWGFDQIRFPMAAVPPKYQGDPLVKNGTVGIHLAWEKLTSEFQLNEATGTDWLNVVVKLSIIEQIGYGSLLQLDTRLNVHNNVIMVNKFHLATYSPYFQAFFFSEWAKDKEEYDLSDPNDDVEVLQLMLAMAYPFENHPQPTNETIGEVLRLADKYDLQIVNERCEKLLISDDEDKIFPLLRKLALAEQYRLFNLKSHCLERISPAHFCLHLRDSVVTYKELSDGLKTELEKRMARRSGDELQAQKPGSDCQNLQQQQQQMEGALPPPHKRVRPRPKTPPRPNYNLPPFRFK